MSPDRVKLNLIWIIVTFFIAIYQNAFSVRSTGKVYSQSTFGLIEQDSEINISACEKFLHKLANSF